VNRLSVITSENKSISVSMEALSWRQAIEPSARQLSAPAGARSGAGGGAAGAATVGW
jgi:hypothetical protein